MEGYCKLCPVCNGRGCRNQIPGPGAKGIGDTAIRNYDKWKEIRIHMDTLTEKKEVRIETELWGKTFSAPVFAGPVGAVNMHYGEKYNDLQYNNILVPACREKGIAAFTGDGMDPEVMISAGKAIKEVQGCGVPTIKPWNKAMIEEKLKIARESGAFAVAMDIDAAGLPFLKGFEPPAGSKSVEELREIIDEAEVPFIVKGIMTPKAALKAREAGASAIVVSNHGGRVLDQCPATAEVLAGIVDAVEGTMKIFVDGGIRDGVDVFKALALGADAVLMARPFVNAVYKDGAEGVRDLVDKISAELADTMAMCGAYSISEISRDMLFLQS